VLVVVLGCLLGYQVGDGRAPVTAGFERIGTEDLKGRKATEPRISFLKVERSDEYLAFLKKHGAHFDEKYL
jgi:hypothetical protein